MQEEASLVTCFVRPLRTHRHHLTATAGVPANFLVPFSSVHCLTQTDMGQLFSSSLSPPLDTSHDRECKRITFDPLEPFTKILRIINVQTVCSFDTVLRF